VEAVRETEFREPAFPNRVWERGKEDRPTSGLSHAHPSCQCLHAAVSLALYEIGSVRPNRHQWTGTSFVDAYKRNRNPTPNEQLAELKNAAFTCASINAAVCAAYPPRLYVATDADQPEPKCLTKRLDRWTEKRLRSRPTLPAVFTRSRQIEEVLDHPLLTLLRKVNPVHNSFDLWTNTNTMSVDPERTRSSPP
jgi:hypothetical protein